MSRQRKTRVLGLAGAALIGLAMPSWVSGCAGDDVPTVACESTRTYFAERVWPVVASKCLGCHNIQGIAKETSYVLKDPSEAGFLDHNLAMVGEVASFEKAGESRWLLKPTAAIEHKGGAIVATSSNEYKTMLGLIVRLKNDQDCKVDPGTAFAGIEMANARATLRKASLTLVGRLPTTEELALIDEHGAAALDPLLDRMMSEPAFIEWTKRTYGDLFQTDFYLNNNATNQIRDQYPNAEWYNEAPKELLAKYGMRRSSELRTFTNVALAREPLELIAHVVRNDLPFGEILTADYSVFTPLSARSYGAVGVEFKDDSDPWGWAPGRYAAPSAENGGGEAYEYPHAGVLTSPIFLSRWPTTETNVNRARARIFMYFFLGTDILNRGTRPTDTTKVTAINPQRDDPNCSMCHVTLDPIAGCFQAFNEEGVWATEPTWFAEMWPPGFGKKQMPLEDAPRGLQWLAAQAVKDERFALSAVYNVYRGLTGREPLIAPNDFDDPLYAQQFRAFFAQANVFKNAASQFRKANDNFKVIVKALVASPYFRGTNSMPRNTSGQAEAAGIGLGRFLPPEMLHQKIVATMGIPWGRAAEPLLVPGPRRHASPGVFQLFYGGVDFDEVSTRITEPNGLMAAVADRMAMQVACQAVSADFARLPEDRKLFPFVNVAGKDRDPLTFVPESSGLAVPQAVEGIKRILVHLHERLLGERLTIDDEEIERSFTLFVETWREGDKLLSDEETSVAFPGQCHATADLYSGAPLTEERQITSDDDYMVRSWMAVMTYLLSDYKFLYE